jgi:hypothetical protein
VGLQEDSQLAEFSSVQPFQNCAKIVPKPFITAGQKKIWRKDAGRSV